MKKSKISLFAVFIILLITSSTLQMPTYPSLIPASSTDVEVEFKVYPDGTVELAADYFYNQTHRYMYYTGPANVRSEVEIEREDELFSVKTNNTIMFSEEQTSQFPFNSTTVNITKKYSQDILNITVDGSVVFPDKWSGSYYNSGYFDIDFDSFPYNSTDLTLTGEYRAGTYQGTLIIHLVPGLTLGDIEVNVEGNTTHMIISDSVKVFYNQTLPIPGFPPLNRTWVEEISQNKDYIDQMLYEATGGLITCEVYNVTIVQNNANSDTLYFEIVLRGEFVDILARIYRSFIEKILFTGYVPYEQREMLGNVCPDLANMTVEVIEEANFELGYISSAKEIDFTFYLSVNLEKLWNMTEQMIVDDLPSEIQPFVEEFLERKYAMAKSYTETVTYENGRIQQTGNYLFEGDLNAEINLIKNLYIDLMIESSYDPPPWQIFFINETEIVDISNLKFSLNQSFEEKTQRVSFSLQGLKIAPPIDPINATCFKLERFFNLTYNPYSEPPRRNERMKLIVKGGSNLTHTAVPVIDPDDPNKPPQPDEILGDNTFIWNNMSMSKLKGLKFLIYEGLGQYVNKDYISPEKPLVVDARNIANCEFIVNVVQNDTIITLKNITLPEGINPPPETYKLLGSYVEITSEAGDIVGNFTIKMYYDPEELIKFGINEKSLKIYRWNSTANEWEPMETFLNSEEHYVWANVNHLSIWAVMGEAVKPIWTETWFLAIIFCAIIALVVAAVFLARRRKSSTET